MLSGRAVVRCTKLPQQLKTVKPRGIRSPPVRRLNPSQLEKVSFLWNEAFFAFWQGEAVKGLKRSVP